MASDPPKVFISYSHVDEAWKKRLVKQLQVLALEDVLEVWDDRRITAGEAWRPAIEVAMESARVALFLVSADFLPLPMPTATPPPRTWPLPQSTCMRLRKSPSGARCACTWLMRTWNGHACACRRMTRKPPAGILGTRASSRSDCQRICLGICSR